jgi:2-methylcitrate dehydratase
MKAYPAVDISNDSYAAEQVRDPRVLALIGKTTVKEDPAFATSGGHAPPTRVTAILKDGRHIAHQIDDMPGFPGQPMTRAQVSQQSRQAHPAGGHGRAAAGAVGA